MKIHNPATGAVIASVEADANAAVRKKYLRARAAQPDWAERSDKKRLATIAAFREQIVQRQEELAQTLTTEIGKPIRQSRNELGGLLTRLDFFLAEAPRTLRSGRGRRSRWR